MKYLPIDNQLFKQNRQRLAAMLKPNSVAFFNANDILPTNADGTLVFNQNTDLFHLSGIDQEESILMLYPDCPDPRYREVLFLRETNEHIAVWEGYKYTIAHAQEVSGIETVQWLNNFDFALRHTVFEAEYIYLPTNEHYRSVNESETREMRFLQMIQRRFPLHKYERTAPLMHQIRAVKLPQEIALIQEACRITELGFRRLLKFVKPGVMEYEIEAELLHEFVRNRSKGFAYVPIVASGANSCVLHYIENCRPCHDGDILLLDVAAEYANYKADLTRTIPVSGRYTPRQKQVYNAVLRVLKATRQLLVVGNNWVDYHKQVGEIMEAELLGLGLITKHDIAHQDPNWPAYKKYFMHGNSHYLGLDVHDIGSRYKPFSAGNVFTCEPGIYIPEEGLGIRIENNILITENANRDLMANIPVEAEEIEELMNS